MAWGGVGVNSLKGFSCHCSLWGAGWGGADVDARQRVRGPDAQSRSHVIKATVVCFAEWGRAARREKACGCA